MVELDQERVFIRQYLLGWLDSETRGQFEERFLTDANFKERVLLIEDELIEDYVDGSLTESERKSFLKRFLSLPQQRQKVELARALDSHARKLDPAISPQASESDEQSKPSSAVRQAVSGSKWFIPSSGLLKPLAYGFGGVIVLALLFGGWKYIQQQRLQRRHSAIERELAQLNTGTELTNTASPLAASIFQLTLEPDRATRGGDPSRRQAEPPQVVITNNIELVQFRLALRTDEPQSYRALLRMDANQESFPVDDLKPGRTERDAIIVVRIPARLLASGHGQIKLYRRTFEAQFEWVDDYDFQVVRP